ncbi:hypothetical protein [Endozoicomonas lisbonensis]|uniref:PNPLA domain-containing protein n=1 Tax=Endozoicomonas lisbonensis TaxID=3120522 RepID=A0ABV2SBX9_9GAMM
MNSLQYWVLVTLLNVTTVFAFSPNNTSPCPDPTTAEIYFDNNEDTSDAENDKRKHLLSDGVGIALSGGGTRAVALSEGQLALFMQKEQYRQQITRVSATSGGAWAIIPYYMQTTEQQKVFLGHNTAELEQLYWGSSDDKNRYNIVWMNPGRLASVPQRMGYYSAALSFFISKHYPYLLPRYQGWKNYLADATLQPYQLNRDAPYNPTQLPGQTNNTELIVNTYLKGKQGEKIPFEMTPDRVGGTKTQFQEADYAMAPCGFNRKTRSSKISCHGQHCWVSLKPGEGLITSDVMATTGANYVNKFPFSLFPPMFTYLEPNQKKKTVEASSRMFADSGNEDFVSIMPLLHRGQKKIIAFVNTGIPLKQGVSGVIGMEKVIPSYFGVIPDESAEMADYSEFKEDSSLNEKDCTTLSSRNQVFDSSHFRELANALWQAKTDGTPIVYLQKKLTILNNSCYGIRGGSTVDIFWVYNDLPKNWFNHLQPALKEKITGNKDFDLFPIYDFTKLYLSAPVANMMSALAKWTIENSSHQWGELFRKE